MGKEKEEEKKKGFRVESRGRYINDKSPSLRGHKRVGKGRGGGGEENCDMQPFFFFSSFSFPPFLSPCGYSRACRSIRARGVLSMTLNTIIFCPLNRRHLHIVIQSATCNECACGIRYGGISSMAEGWF